METVQERRAAPEQAKKSFDVLASVKLYRHDLENCGYILDETRQRVYDEEVSYIAEGINRPNDGEFILEERQGQIAYFHEGRWQPYIATLITGLETAKREAELDHRKNFEIERRQADLMRGYELTKLQPGQKYRWYHDFPQAALDAYGPEFLGSLGFQPERRMGFLYEAERLADGRLAMRHQSVDNWDDQAGHQALQASSIDEMRQLYDDELRRQSGSNYFAGRPINDRLPEETAWSIIARHSNLIERYFMDQIEALARSDLETSELERAKKRLTYGVWAQVKLNLEADAIAPGLTVDADYDADRVSAGVAAAYGIMAERGEELLGCGGSITGEKAILSASAKDVFNAIFGGNLVHMSCPFCGAGQYGDPCASRLYCQACEAEVRQGQVVSKGKQIQKASWAESLFDWIAQDLKFIDAVRKARELKKAKSSWSIW